MHREQPAERDACALDPRRLEHDIKCLVEGVLLPPEDVGPVGILVPLPAPLLVHVVARLGEERRAVLQLSAEPVERGLEEVLVEHDLVVVEEDGGVVPEHRRGDEADVAHRAVAGERDALDHVGELELLEPAVQRAHLGGPEDDRVDVGEIVDDLAHAVLGLMSDGLVGDRDDHDDPTEPAHLPQRLKALRERAVFVQRRRMVVDGGHLVDGRAAPAASAASPECRDDYDWFHRLQAPGVRCCPRSDDPLAPAGRPTRTMIPERQRARRQRSMAGGAPSMLSAVTRHRSSASSSTRYGRLPMSSSLQTSAEGVALIPIDSARW